MINLLTGVNGQFPVKGKQHTAKGGFETKKQTAMEEQLSGAEGDSRKEEFKSVAKEMESLFAFQLLKVMRETSESMSGEKKGNDYNTYMSMFDTEISKVLAERGMGLQDSIVRWLERDQSVNNINNKDFSKVNEKN